VHPWRDLRDLVFENLDLVFEDVTALQMHIGMN